MSASGLAAAVRQSVDGGRREGGGLLELGWASASTGSPWSWSAVSPSMGRATARNGRLG